MIVEMDLEFDDEYGIVFSREPILYLKIQLLLTSVDGMWMGKTASELSIETRVES